MLLSKLLMCVCAQKAVELADKIFGDASNTLRAMAYELLARTLIVNQCYHDEEYIKCAQRAYSMAMDMLPTMHPKLASYRMTNGKLRDLDVLLIHIRFIYEL